MLASYWPVAVVILIVLAMLAALRRRTAPPRQTTWAFCPGCVVDLCSNPAVTFDETDRRGTTVFRCPCGARSVWDFNAPAPILLHSDKRSPLGQPYR